MNNLIIYVIITGVIGIIIAIKGSLELRNRFGYITIAEIFYCFLALVTAWFWLPLILCAEVSDYIVELCKKINNIRFFEVKKSTYDPEATCCTPNEK